ncbi:HupE/UreJ family protein [uncultured Zhongshania sp.]|uniref:HupE/UreJ family protein n=1 Tax=uncultured Zhongshania sp. TaxID=1642288 RepID=UPI0030DD7DFC
MRRSISSLVTALVMVIFALPALAHKASDSFMYITAEHIRLDIAVQDMARIQTLDANADAAVSWGELRAVEAEFSELLRRQISLSQNTEPCALLISLEGISEHSDGNYAVWQLASECLSKPGVKLDYSLLFDIDPLHRALIVSDLSGEKQISVLSPASPSLALGEAISALDTAEVFIWQGVIHLLLGYDHMLFLLALLLPATRRKHAGGATQSLRAVFTDVAVVVTMFTLAHSFTLIAASLGWFSLPSQPVEIAIALSISLAAVLALLDVDVRFQRGLAMGVGLIHGFGFAGVLSDLLAASPLKLLALGSFNVGIELAQLALVIIVLPLLYRYSFHPWYQKKAFPLAAIALAVSGLYMALQRI